MGAAPAPTMWLESHLSDSVWLFGLDFSVQGMIENIWPLEIPMEITNSIKQLTLCHGKSGRPNNTVI